MLALVGLFELERTMRKPPAEVWDQSPFAWLNVWPSSRTVGAIFESVVQRWCEGMGLNVARTGDSEADRVIGGRRFEIKGSTLWKGGTYKFQQIRKQTYDAVICLGVSPFDAYCWMIPKPEVVRRIERGDIAPQHTGKKGEETYWLVFDPDAPPEWLDEWGGSLSEAKRVLRQFISASRD